MSNSIAGGSRTTTVSKPRVSVLTFVRNAVNTLPLTIACVDAQTSKDNIEYIVVDGESTDGTVEVIKSLDSKISKWISEKDRGIVDAQNKAIKLAVGDYVFCLNADDWVDPDFIEKALQAIGCGEVDIVYGDVVVHAEDGKELHRLAGSERFFSTLGSKYQMPCVNFPTMVIKRSLFDRVGFFDESFKVAPDFEWLLRANKNIFDIKILYLKGLVTHFRLGGNSDLHYFDGLKEAKRASLLHGGGTFLANCYMFKRVLMHCFKSIVFKSFPPAVVQHCLNFFRRYLV
ncbi:glycosyltransferase family 2 protein [Chromobacterium sp. IIBBL 290-4]|uniref:glycosyltransferase family 2 protein n=1 Tax=Chromobacterium sp. IIBBL 290-4 TaxID=2953890 RepID=UPI0020B79C9B|nr:glycosyltransferase family 2 protein [Chromobacterium sp. IIBBL 290-4]UTH72844.1 glycosyltransferase [Chromobacterium sp. IIBBL 290-4]